LCVDECVDVCVSHFNNIWKLRPKEVEKGRRGSIPPVQSLKYLLINGYSIKHKMYQIPI